MDNHKNIDNYLNSQYIMVYFKILFLNDCFTLAFEAYFIYFERLFDTCNWSVPELSIFYIVF